ncbi:hypothetical protein SDRG_15362 [Saprolegnia diclina VS20]|uniref:Transmembrane protein 53 n=1 Tax=Saprolegnia diclina (strain VS20) TaxID=1156394 RepID=T0RBC5_SAPDV|nr:hypothetical protein SDRG_15362 [Saprolegnia diclina VS20]EQC26852.1 hypothetical protein SDRG_15362 [Saprolegnia diclina VS20]|eukprot:XP_008619754.1 hypothetical protein SDRG_15362 [Saprolegnia diclina VS20]
MAQARSTDAIGDKNDVLVLVCSWMNSAPRHAAKYAALYNDIGFRHTTIVPSSGLDFFLPASSVHAETAARLCDPTKTLRLHVHIMSNGGARSWYCLETHLQRLHQPYIVTSFVFDSAPTLVRGGFTDPTVFVQHIRNPLARGALYGVMKVVLWSLNALLFVLHRDHVLALNFESQIANTGAIPKLFLYSRADKLIPLADFQDAMQAAKDTGATVHGVDFMTSPHVGHYQAHPEAYRAALASFL